jgi:hypothetical protein
MTHEEGYLIAEEPSVDLEIAELMASELEAYIVSDDLYRTVTARTSAGDKRLNMSGGDLLARLGRLQGERAVLTEDERSRLDAVQETVDATIYSLQTRFFQRLNRELKARLDSLRWFMDECADDRKQCRTEYPFEIRNRQRIEEILKRLGDQASPALVTGLSQIDRRIRQYTESSQFVWDKRLADIYPPDQYWYLYRRPTGGAASSDDR